MTISTIELDTVDPSDVEAVHAAAAKAQAHLDNWAAHIAELKASADAADANFKNEPSAKSHAAAAVATQLLANAQTKAAQAQKDLAPVFRVAALSEHAQLAKAARLELSDLSKELREKLKEAAEAIKAFEKASTDRVIACNRAVEKANNMALRLGTPEIRHATLTPVHVEVADALASVELMQRFDVTPTGPWRS